MNILEECHTKKLRLTELLSMEPIQIWGLLKSIKRLQSWKDNGTGWHGWVILFLNQQLCLNINADKAEYSESRTALNRSPSNVPLAISRAFLGWVKTGNLIGPHAVPYLDYKVKRVWNCQIKGRHFHESHPFSQAWWEETSCSVRIAVQKICRTWHLTSQFSSTPVATLFLDLGWQSFNTTPSN